MHLVLQTPVKALSSKKTSILSRIKNVDFQSSTKIEALREELHKMLQADPSAKAIVFSQFTSMLDLVSFRLEQVSLLMSLPPSPPPPPPSTTPPEAADDHEL